MRCEGVEIISNSSGSHHELKKLDTRINLITQATKLVINPSTPHGVTLLILSERRYLPVCQPARVRRR